MRYSRSLSSGGRGITLSWVTSEVDVDPIAVRLVLLAMMLASLVMAVAVPEAFRGHGLLFAASYVAIKVGRLVCLTFDPSAVKAFLTGRGSRLLIWSAVSVVLWIAGGLVDGSARTELWIVAIALDLTGPMVLYWVPWRGRSQFSAWTPRTSHFVERFGLFVLIALGETIVLTGATTSQLVLDHARFAALTLAFLGTAALWWLYFDDFTQIAKRRLEVAANPTQLARDAYMYLHLILVAGVLLSAVGDKIVIAQPTRGLADAEVAVVAAGPALYLLGHVLFRLRMTGWISWERLGGAVACVLAGLTGTAVPGLALATLLVAALVVVIAIEQVAGRRHRAWGAPSPFEQLEESAA
jgi:low temperature requirement protein LtrA